MSRIGKNPIPIPSGVTVKIDGNLSVVKGPKGEHKQHVPEGLIFEEKDGQLTVSRPDDSKPVRAKHGLVRALIANQVHGVTEGWARRCRSRSSLNFSGKSRRPDRPDFRSMPRTTVSS